MNEPYVTAPVSEHRSRRRRTPLSPLEWIALIHLGVFLIASSWAFGGQADWVRPPLTAWGCLSVLIALAAILQERPQAPRWQELCSWAAPILLFNAVVLLSTFNPSLQQIQYGGETLLAAVGGRPGWPSAAQPALGRTALLQFDATWLSCFNIVLVLKRRRAIRIFLAAATGNVLALAIFGTVQKLSGATGLYFGTVSTPQMYFFASFVYHNHWGAFALLMAATVLGLGRHFARHHDARDIFHSPAGMALVVVIITVATIPLSGSRSATVLAALLLGGVFVRWLLRLIRKRRHFNESIAPPVALALSAAVLCSAAVWYVARDTIHHRAELTIEQITAARTATAPDTRIELYRDTWRMAMAKPWFGWGMASYPYVFTIFNTRAPIPHFPVFYHDAHSDWLQSLAEHGLIGSLLVAASVLIPLASIRRRVIRTPLCVYPLAGCGILIVYALLEFPFGNFAVVLGWWACFFSAIQYARLGDTVDHMQPAPQDW